MNTLSEDKWILEDPQILEILNYVKKTCIQLKDLKPKIYRGITTGYNEAFIIDTETRNKLIREDPKSAELIKPLLRGRDIEPYKINWNDKWIIIIPAGFTNSIKDKDMSAEEFFSKTFPSIYRHLSSFINSSGKGKGLIDRDDMGDYWWELRPCDYYPEFEKPKIIWQEISKKPSFAYDVAGFYSLAKTFIAVGLPKSYLIILNSNISYFLFKRITVILSHGYLEWQKTYVENLYIPKLNKRDLYILNTLVDYISFMNYLNNLEDIKDFLIKLINAIIYELYFKEKIYPKPNNYIIKIISENIIPINFDLWGKLYWKTKVHRNLSNYEKKIFNEITSSNILIIRKFFESLQKNSELFQLMKMIYNYPWVKIIEEEISKTQ